ncbi:hypothetical protein EUTSA_v10000781mg [Eutrema salsugineum]|uniref:Replication protein A subunit n=1 Tax=Eutrema salsugineum TaxID=72664 RepID=V4LBA9_EUTSA|nr:replication protein A 70 kDa DNA-binding subunit C [Eutrema salsugineum]ESQ39667.1 hypothetical protein EUTSA_v10000781mg [Eutrema salsugineum]
MAANLTAGAVAKMLNGAVSSEAEMVPILQVTDLKLIQSKLKQSRQNQDLSQERYKLSLSDGYKTQEGMLNTNMNTLVNQGTIQVGSILRLTRFVCNLIQHRRIVMVLELDIIAEKCHIIGNPAQTLTPIAQPVGNPEQQQARRSELNGVRQVNDSSAARFGVANPPQPHVPETSLSTLPYVSSTSGYGSSRQEQIRPPQAASSRPVQPSYKPQQQPQQPSMYVNRGPVARNEAPARIIPISALNPYQGRWTIKVRVTSKGELRRFNGPRGDGKVFSFDLVDADGGEIRVTCFNDVVDQFFDVIVVGNVYLISKGSLKPARKEYNHLPNDYEIHLDNASTIQQCHEDDAAIPRNQFHFRNISDIENMENNGITDLIGIVSSISPTGSIMRKNGTEAQKRALQLKDMSGRSVEVTMWGNFCNAEGQKLQNLCDSGVFPVLAVKAGRISEFNGKQVSTIGSSQLFIEPDLPEARELREWYEREGRNAPCTSISREFSGSGREEVRKVITQIKDEKLGTSEKPDWITVSGTISFMKVDNFCYTACPIMNGDRPCSKKVTNNGDGTWRCERCDRCVDECDYRYILQLQLQDHTGITWATAFQEAGEEIMGMPAKDLYYMKYEDRDEDKFEDIIRKAAFTKYIFKLKIKEETYSDEQRVKATVVKAEKVNYSSDTRFLLDAINKLRTEDANPLPINQVTSSHGSGAFNSGIGTSGTRETSSVDVPRREIRLPAANQVSQFGNEHTSGSRPLGGITYCNACGGNGHAADNCPSFMSEPQGQHTSSAYRSTPGGYAAGGMPRQHVRS